MAIVSSYGQLTSVAAPSPGLLSTVQTSGPFYDGHRRTYAQIYRTQPAVRTVVEFFSRNIAQLGLHAFRRISDTERQRLFGHEAEQSVRKPNPATTRFRLFRDTVEDIGTYANGYWLKVRTPGRLGLVRLPAGEVGVVGTLLPTEYQWTAAATGRLVPFAPSEIVHFRMYDPANPAMGLPPIETLRRVLAEAYASGEYRQQFWQGAARSEVIITRPAAAPRWGEAGASGKSQRDQFREQWQEFAGGGAKAGKAPVLEDGMDVKLVGFNAKDSEYLGSLKLTREIVAAEYHVPLPMVGILDHATFSNIREQHKQLYQDCLGPWLTMLEEDIELQLLPEFDDVENVYFEFNIQAKLAGAFEEQTESLTKAIGRPFMTPNEGRARLNMARDSDPESDKIARNLNQATTPAASGAQAQQARASIARFWARQQARVEKDPPEDRAARFDLARWDRELAADLQPVYGDRAPAIAHRFNLGTRAALEAGESPWPAFHLDAAMAWIAEQES